MNYFVYIWNSPEGIPYYVGEGQGTRWWAARNIPRPKSQSDVQTFYAESKEDCWSYEEFLITFFGRKIDGGTLLNQALGGPGARGVTRSEQFKNNQSARQREAVILVSPNDEEFYVQNVKGFARDKGLSGNLLCAVARGENVSHLGWRLKGKTISKRDYSLNPVTLISPDNKHYIVTCLTAHARTFSLDVSQLSKVVNQSRSQCKGWRLALDCLSKADFE